MQPNADHAWSAIRLTTSTHRTASRASVRALAFSLGLASMLVSPTIRAQKSPLAKAAAARAQEHLAAEQYPEAIRELQTAVRYEPRFALGWYLLASSYRRSADCDRAVAAYRRYSELRPAEAEPHYGIGRCLEAVGDGAGAAAEFLRYAGAEKKPEERTFVDDARKRAEALNRKLAIAAKQTEAAEPPALVEASTLRQQHHLTESIAAYRTWLAQNAKDESALAARANAELGSLLVITNDLPAAIVALRAAIRLKPADARSWYNLAFALRDEGQLNDAVGAFFRYVTFKPDDPDPYYGLGLSLSKLGRGDEALAALRTYVKLEKRPAEQRWVAKARADLARLAARPPHEPKEKEPAGERRPTGPGGSRPPVPASPSPQPAPSKAQAKAAGAAPSPPPSRSHLESSDHPLAPR
jgi:Flp pilus assembly protein TadD